MGEDIGRYLYCLIQAEKDISFGPIGIAGEGNAVYTVLHDGMAAVVSDTPVKEYDVSRSNMLAHQRVNECVMKDYVILPFKFCTIADRPDLIPRKVLVPRQKDFEKLFTYMVDKQEHGVRVVWTDMERVFEELLEERPELRRRRDELARLAPDRGRQEKVELGLRVKKALEEKKADVEARLFRELSPFAVEAKKNKLHGDRMVLNSAFLISREGQAAFDAKVAECSGRWAERMQWKYFGPTQPSNFVEIVVHWDEGSR